MITSVDTIKDVLHDKLPLLVAVINSEYETSRFISKQLLDYVTSLHISDNVLAVLDTNDLQVKFSLHYFSIRSEPSVILYKAGRELKRWESIKVIDKVPEIVSELVEVLSES